MKNFKDLSDQWASIADSMKGLEGIVISPIKTTQEAWQAKNEAELQKLVEEHAKKVAEESK